MTIGTTAMRLAVDALKQAALTVLDELKNPDCAEDVKAELQQTLYDNPELDKVFEELRIKSLPTASEDLESQGAVDQGDGAGTADAPDTAGNAALEPGVDDGKPSTEDLDKDAAEKAAAASTLGESADTAAQGDTAPADATA